MNLLMRASRGRNQHTNMQKGNAAPVIAIQERNCTSLPVSILIPPPPPPLCQISTHFKRIFLENGQVHLHPACLELEPTIDAQLSHYRFSVQSGGSQQYLHNAQFRKKSNSNQFKSKRHKSQCCGQKCTRVRCAQVKFVKGRHRKAITISAWETLAQDRAGWLKLVTKCAFRHWEFSATAISVRHKSHTRGEEEVPGAACPRD